MMDGATYVPLADRGVIGVAGEDNRRFLQGLISNDVNKVQADRAIYATLLTPQGKFLHDFFIVEWNGMLLLDCEGERAGDLLRRLGLYKLRAKIMLSDMSASLRVMALFGPAAGERLGLPAEPGRAKTFANGVVFCDPRLVALGFRAILSAESTVQAFDQAGFQTAPAGAYEHLRLSQGVPDGSRDLPVEKAFLLEHNIDELNGIDFNKGCYVGQELTARTKHRGLVRKRLFRVAVDGPLPAPGTPILMGTTEVGEMRSGLDHMAIALIRTEAVDALGNEGPLRAGEAKLTPMKPEWAKF